jgi:hypothetical protein
VLLGYRVVVAEDRCPFCAGVTDSREHVLPRWFLKRWQAQGPFPVDVNGVEMTTSAGKLFAPDNFQPVLLAICSGCNGRLDRLFEKPAKPYVRALLDDGRDLDSVGTRQFARWMAKTMLLARHPDAVYEALATQPEPNRKRCNPWEPFPAGALAALLNGELIDDLSLWVGVVHPRASSVHMPTSERIVLGSTYRADGAGGVGNAAQLGIGLSGERVAVFHLVFHPLQDFEHPFEAAGLLTRLWPTPPDTLDLTTHPLLDLDAHRALGHVFMAGGGGVHLRPAQRWQTQAPWPWHMPKPDDWPDMPADRGGQ